MPGPPVLHPYDPVWPERAAQLLAGVEAALAPLELAESFEHIGSTSVPGLSAKPYIDLQVRLRELPEPRLLDDALAVAGFVPARGSRPDSPGVDRDIPRGSEVVPDDVWRKRLFVHDSGEAILHIRLSASPWGRYTVWFRDWLRSHPEACDRYADFKATAAAVHAHDADYDDYTRAKTAFFDEVQEEFEAWARRGTTLSSSAGTSVVAEVSNSRIVVAREVHAEPAAVFALLADPRRHPEIDGSGTLRAAAGTRPITGTGQSFVMDMDLTAVGHPEHADYQTENHVVDFVPGERIAWATARRGQTPPGVWWSYALSRTTPGRTLVVHTYDWSRVTDPAVLARVAFPRIPADRLSQTLERLAAVVERRSLEVQSP